MGVNLPVKDLVGELVEIKILNQRIIDVLRFLIKIDTPTNNSI